MSITCRVDRTATNKRIGYSSALTMLEAVDGDTRPLEITDDGGDRSPRATAALTQLWRRTAFTMPISNTDDHPRSHWVLNAGSSTRRVSPAVDLNSDPEPGPKCIAAAIDEETRTRIDTLVSVPRGSVWNARTL